jgi:hypothetical protein
MKKITFLSLLMFATLGFAQSKTTGVVTLTSNMTANLTLNSTTAKATLELTGPSDRWFSLQFGSFAAGGGMASGQDVVYTTATALVDAKFIGIGAAPQADPINNWTVLSNTIVSGIRTIIAERNLSTGDANDYTFNYADPTIDFVWAKYGSASFDFAYHGPNRGYALNKTFTTLGIEDFTLNAAVVYPNPSNGAFTIKTKTALDKIEVYSQTGAFVKTIDVKATSETEVKIEGLATGIYLIQLQNATEKSWKKIMVGN